MFGFRSGDRVIVKHKGEEATIIRNFITTTGYLVRNDRGEEYIADRNDMIKITKK